jgi:uncharacterized protein involved in tellurium resistance
MKSLHIFRIYVNQEEEIPRDTLEYEKPRVNVTQRSPWNSIYVNFSHEKGARTSLLMLLVDRLMKEDYFS